MGLSDFIETREERKERKIRITKGQIKAIKDYASSILAKVNYIEFTQSAVEDEIISYEDARKIIGWQKKQISENIEQLKSYTDERGMKNEFK